MSKTRLNITAFTVDARSTSEVAREYGVTRSWVYILLARYQLTTDRQSRYHGTGTKIGGPKRPYGPRKNKQIGP